MTSIMWMMVLIGGLVALAVFLLAFAIGHTYSARHEVEERFGAWVQALRRALGSPVRWRTASRSARCLRPKYMAHESSAKQP